MLNTCPRKHSSHRFVLVLSFISLLGLAVMAAGSAIRTTFLSVNAAGNAATTLSAAAIHHLSHLFSSVVPVPKSGRGLTLQERVTYQRAIEEIYWRHRIWNAENSKPKPTLDEALPLVQIQHKVETYLRQSQALADYWQSPVTPEQLQAEMTRMARDTKQPEVLQEIYDALKNDP
jgi:hypothetical protein